MDNLLTLDPLSIIDEYRETRRDRSDQDILAELADLPPLDDYVGDRWNDPQCWYRAYLFIALAQIAAERRLKPAIALLLDRACYGDPGEMMRGLRHFLEAIVAPDWSELTDICLIAASSRRLGTRLWAIDELARLEDPRARAELEAAAQKGPDEIRDLAQRGLARLDSHASTEPHN